MECTKALAHSCILALEVQSEVAHRTQRGEVEAMSAQLKNSCLKKKKHQHDVVQHQHEAHQLGDNLKCQCNVFFLCSDGSQVTKFTPFSHKLQHLKQSAALL